MTLAQPGWLALILLAPLLVIAAVVASRLRARQWAAFVSDRLRPRLLQRSSPVPRWISLACLVAALVLLSIALSRPQARRGTDDEEILGRNIILALDLSRSMKVADVKPDRLTQAKALSYELLEALRVARERVGELADLVVGIARQARGVEQRGVRCRRV